MSKLMDLGGDSVAHISGEGSYKSKLLLEGPPRKMLLVSQAAVLILAF